MGIRTLVAAAACVVTALSGGMAAAAPASATGPAAATEREDFNGDGYQDLAVAAPAATVNGHSWAGYIAISYGSAQGLGTAHTTIITQDTPECPALLVTTTASATGCSPATSTVTASPTSPW